MPQLQRPALLVVAGTGISALLMLAALLLYINAGREGSGSVSQASATAAVPRTAMPTAAATARFAPTIIGLKLADDPEAPARAAFPVTDRLFACFAAQGGTDSGTLSLLVTADGLSAPPADGTGIAARALPVAQSADHACYRLDVARPPLTPGRYQVMIVLGNAVLARAPFDALPPGALTATATPSPSRTATVTTPPRLTSVPTPPATPPSTAPAVVATATLPPATPVLTPAPTPSPPPPPSPAQTSLPPTAAPATPPPTPIRTVPPPALGDLTPRPPPIPPPPTVRPSATPAG